MGKKPSRKRYEKRNPSVSFRISRDSKEKLDEMAEDLEITKKEWLEGMIREAALDLETAVNKGYERGYTEAKDEFGVQVPCAAPSCDNDVLVYGDEVKETLYRLISYVTESEYGGNPDDPQFTWPYPCQECGEKQAELSETIEKVSRD